MRINQPCPPLSVHPHACGEHGDGWRNPGNRFGSSPRMWGTPFFGEGYGVGLRFIPTHVGNTFHLAFSAAISSVHPHACGEHVRYSVGLRPKDGSSPRMWGTLKKHQKINRPSRFIPTHVGNTCPRPHSTSIKSVHPHACGEHLMADSIRLFGDGSSPRMWGTPLAVEVLERFARFIPTHVGNTSPAA